MINLIEKIYNNHKGRYVYRRITLVLNNEGININHKKVLRIMRNLGLKGMMRNKRKYSSYKRRIGKIADNIIKRNFEADRANLKRFTDVTKFNLKEEKLYLSPILDACGRYIVSYNISKSPNLKQIKDMLTKVLNSDIDYSNLILHSDQGWQYQHKYYQKVLSDNNIIQSMSRKGNIIDNGLMKSFFGILKSKMFYGQENKYKNLDELKVAIDNYIYYYNFKRIKVKLKGLTSALYKSQSL